MVTNILNSSSNISKEYCATVVKLGTIAPVEGSDFLGYTLVKGFPIVVRKDEVKEGDLMVYCQNETCLNLDFLSANNCFDWENKEKNQNYSSVIAPLLEEGKKDEAKRFCGFINKHGRIRMIKLRGQVSMGILFPVNAIFKWKPELEENLNLEDYLGQDFDTVGKDLFIKVYVPPVTARESNKQNGNTGSYGKRFDRIVEGQFAFHYDTQNLQRNSHRLNPEDEVAISVKLHGTSAIFANILTRRQKPRTKLEVVMCSWAKKHYKSQVVKERRGKAKFKYEKQPSSSSLSESFRRLIDKTKKQTILEYGNVFSSRSVIKNRYTYSRQITPKVDIWSEYNDILKPFIPEGYTIYGEICGYMTDSERMVQKGYDYGCSVGKNFFMPYRITIKKEDGPKKELNVKEVLDWTVDLLKKHPELKEYIHPLSMLFTGKLVDRYPEIPVDENWNDNVMKALEQDLSFGMEGLEPLCTGHKVPREGFCLRINNDPIAECFKCKCKSFLFRESKEVDNGSVDIEMSQGYGE